MFMSDAPIDRRVRGIPLDVQALLRQPVQAAQRTSLTIDGSNEEPGFLDISIFDDEDWTLVEAALDGVSVSVEEKAEWVSDIRKGIWDALTALELTLLPNMESLVFTGVGCDFDDAFKWVKKAMLKVRTSQRGADESAFLLPKLRSVSLSWWDTENGMELEQVLDFMSVPSVQQCEAFMVSTEDWTPSPGMSFSVKELRLRMSSIHSEALQNLIQCCPQLEKFSYEAGGAVVGYSVLIPSVLSPALATLKPCLQELELIADDYDMESDHEGDPQKRMASFRDFENLHTLSLSACMLVGKDKHDGRDDQMELDLMELVLEDAGQQTARLVDVVPKFLKKLSLDNCGSGILGQLEELLARKEDRTTLLARIEILTNGPIDKEEAQRLVDEYKERNVVLEIQMS